VVSEGPIRISLTGRLQTQLNTSTADSVYSTFEHRRARLGADLAIDEWIEGRIEYNFAAQRLEDGWMNLALDPMLELQVGQFKKPFSRLELTSSSRIVPIEYGLRIRGLDASAEHYLLLEENVYLGRELGAQIHGTIGMLGYAVGIFNGSDQNNRDHNDAKSFAGRFNLKPFESAPFELGAGASWRDVELVDTLDERFTEEGLAVEIDALWGGFRRPGLTLVAEVMQAENFATEDPMVGAQGIVSWFQPLDGGRVEGVEPLFRASYGDPTTELGDDSGILLTPGINVYFHGRNRLMLNFDYYMPEAEVLDPEHSIRGQLQLYF
jgi:hypothetical protein